MQSSNAGASPSVQDPLSFWKDPRMSNMDEEKKLQSPSANGSAGGQEEDAGKCVKTDNKIAILIVISHLIFGVVLFFLGSSLSSYHQKDAIKCIPITCPPDWIGYQGHCYNRSEEEKNWTESQNDCISHNSSLAKITKEEMEFLKMLTRHQVFWIGLKREKYQPWKWLDGENATLEVSGNGGDCAYLNGDATANSGTCSIKHRYICQKRYMIL